jgi:hypothetical protein
MMKRILVAAMGFALLGAMPAAASRWEWRGDLNWWRITQDLDSIRAVGNGVYEVNAFKISFIPDEPSEMVRLRIECGEETTSFPYSIISFTKYDRWGAMGASGGQEADDKELFDSVGMYVCPNGAARGWTNHIFADDAPPFTKTRAGLLAKYRETYAGYVTREFGNFGPGAFLLFYEGQAMGPVTTTVTGCESSFTMANGRKLRLAHPYSRVVRRDTTTPPSLQFSDVDASIRLAANPEAGEMAVKYGLIAVEKVYQLLLPLCEQPTSAGR